MSLFVENLTHMKTLHAMQAVWEKSRVARFFSVQHTKTEKYIPIAHKVYEMATK
jgi:hypothetical protein